MDILRKLRAASVLGFIAATSTAMPAFAEDWAEVVAKAEKEGEVILYIATPPAVTEPVIAAFQAKYPKIKATYIRDSAAVLVTRYESERNTTGMSPADVVEGATFSSLTNKHSDWFLPVAGAPADFVPSLADFPASAKSENSVISAAYNWTLSYNTGAMSGDNLPKNWKDLADPKWAGKGMMIDPRQSPSYLSWYVFQREQLGDDYLKALGANKFVLSNGGAPATQAVAAGQVEFAFPVARSHSASIRASGAPVEHLDLTPFQVNSTIQAYPTKAPHPYAARVLANFMLSPEAQQMYCDLGDLASFNSKAAGSCPGLAIAADVSRANLDISEKVKDEIAVLMGLQ